MRFHHRTLWSVPVIIALSAPALAQPVPQLQEWTHGTTVNVFAGVALDAGESGPVGGGAVGWEIAPAIAIEGSAAWLDRGGGAHAFAAGLKLQAGLMRPRPVVPFVEAGVGLYRASFDPLRGTVPGFYRRRFEEARRAMITFTDPSIVLGGGVNVFLTRHLAIRPGVETMIVIRHGRTYVVTAVAVHAAYHFESHPVTPGRNGQ